MIGLLRLALNGFFAGLFGLAGALSIYLAWRRALIFVAGLLLLLFDATEFTVEASGFSVVAVDRSRGSAPPATFASFRLRCGIRSWSFHLGQFVAILCSGGRRWLLIAEKYGFGGCRGALLFRSKLDERL